MEVVRVYCVLSNCSILVGMGFSLKSVTKTILIRTWTQVSTREDGKVVALLLCTLWNPPPTRSIWDFISILSSQTHSSEIKIQNVRQRPIIPERRTGISRIFDTYDIPKIKITI